MALRHRKGPGIVAQKRLASCLRPFYVQAYLWESCEAMNAGAPSPGSKAQPAPPGRDDNGEAGALCCLAEYAVSFPEGDDETAIVEVRPRIAEVHFYRGGWTQEIVAHELTHAIIHRMRVMPPWGGQVEAQDGDAEETVCYEMGRWFDACYRWLWEVDPSDKRERRAPEAARR